MKRASVHAVLSASSFRPMIEWGEEVEVCGWVRTKRDSKNVSFIVLYDGSTFNSLQVVVDAGLGVDLTEVKSGASIRVVGKSVKSKGQGQEVDFEVSELTVIGTVDEDYPIQPKKHSMDFFREHPHLRVRTQLFQAIMSIRSRLKMATYQYFGGQGFIQVDTPIITGSDCEGAGEMFRVTTHPAGYKHSLKTSEIAPMKFRDNESGELFEKPNHLELKPIYDHSEDFFGKEAGLTVSGQLEAETAMFGLGRVFTFGPTFRAENSNTTRHLAEFWMMEPEMAFADLNFNMEIAEEYLKYVIADVLKFCSSEIDYLEKYIQDEEKNLKKEDQSIPLSEKLEDTIFEDFEKVSYTEAFDILKNSKPAKKGQFKFPVEEWGMDLQSEHERFLVEKHFKKPVIVYDYPKKSKAFYMRDNDDGKTVAAMDILFPGIGEIVGGSQREERVDVLKEKMTTFGISHEDMKWYIDTRRFGSVPHSGFGLGFERLVQFVTGMKNIKDVALYPRTPGNI
jgi:asparaginyl-tRNA synthetase